MKACIAIALMGLTLAHAVKLALPTTCPPRGFDSVTNFDLLKYTSKPWFVQAQEPLTYQPESSLFCVRALYQKRGTPDGAYYVQNYSNKEKVNGEVMSSQTMPGQKNANGIIAFPADKGPAATRASKLLVGPSFLEPVFKSGIKNVFGDYWVVAVDPAYEWAIVSGGAPTRNTGKGCSGGLPVLYQYQTNGVGLWFFSRKQVDPAGAAKMAQVAKSLGYDIGRVKPVAQAGCKYEGAIAA